MSGPLKDESPGGNAPRPSIEPSVENVGERPDTRNDSDDLCELVDAPNEPTGKPVLSSDLRIVKEHPDLGALIVELPGYSTGVNRQAIFLLGGDRRRTLRLVKALHARKLLAPNCHHVLAWSEPSEGWSLVLDGGEEQIAALRRAIALLAWAFGNLVVAGCDALMLATVERWELGHHDAPSEGRPV